MELESKTVDPRRFGEGADAEPDDDGQATETEQQDYDLLTVRARKMIFGPAKENILRMLGSSETPAQGMGQAGAMLIKSLVVAAQEGGREMEAAAVLEAATDVIVDLNDLAKANNVFQYDSPEDEQQQMEEAMLWGVKHYGDGAVANGEITPELQEMAQRQVRDGIAEEGGPKKTPIAAGVGQAMAPPGGLVGNAMQGAV